MNADVNLSEELNRDWNRINHMMRGKGVYTDEVTGKRYFTGYAYKTLYDWDQYFESVVQLYLGWDTALIKNGVTIFLDNQQENGFIWRSVPRAPGGQGDEHVKPFLAQIAMLLYRYEKNLGWLDDHYYDRLKKYLLYWLDVKDQNKNNLSVWDSAPHSGMDNQHERAGYWYGGFCEGVDLNCYLIRDCTAMAEIAKIKNRPTDASFFESRAGAVRAAVGTLWDEEDGLFYDRDARTGRPIKVKYAGIFAALWAGAATEEQARRMVTEHLTNKDEFWRAFPVSSYSATEPGYTEGFLPDDLGCGWRANTWIPVNYYIFEGLRNYGFAEIARNLAFRTYEAIKSIGDREYYTSDSMRGCGLDPFWGWSLLAYFMPFEAETGYDPTKIVPSESGAAALRVL